MITIFEKYKDNGKNGKKFWRVRTDFPHLMLSLKDIGVEEPALSTMLDSYKFINSIVNSEGFNYKEIYVGKDAQNKWGWKPPDQGWQTYNRDGYEYMGIVEISDYQLDAFKYNL